MSISALVSQAPLPNLILSLIFGVGQVIVGAAMVIYTSRRARWCQFTFFGLALIGAWLAASGITELIVSGTELSIRLGSSISAASFQHIRADADTALLVVSLALLIIGAAYLLLARRWRTARSSTAALANEGNETAKEEATPGETAAASSSEPEG